MNIFTLDISNGLRDHEVGAGEYLLLIDAPPLANVTVKPNSQFGATGIPLKSGHDVRSRKEVNKWFISADAVAGGTIKILMSDSEEPLTINTVPSDVNVSEIGSLGMLGANALTQFDNMLNPYVISPTLMLNTFSNTTITVLSKTLTCDHIDMSFSAGLCNAGYWGIVKVTIDGAIVAAQMLGNNVTYGGEYSSYYDHISIDGVRGKNISIQMGNNWTDSSCTMFLTEKTLKA